MDVDAGNLADEEHESVFIGNDPEDFFDPTVFLTRSALQDDQGNKPSTSASQTIAGGEIQDPMADTLAEGMGSAASSKPFDLAKETQIDQAETEPGYLADEAKADPISESETWAETEADSESNTDSRITIESEAEHADFFAALEESVDGLETTDEIEELKAIAELDALDSVSEAVPTAQIEEQTTPQTRAEPEAVPGIRDAPAGQTAAELPASDDSDTGQDTPTEPSRFLAPESTTVAPTQRPEDISLSISFSVQQRPTALNAETAALADAETQGKADHAEQQDINQDGSASDSNLADMDSGATIAIETQAGIDLGKEHQGAIAEDNPPTDELPSAIGEAASEPALSEPELDSTTQYEKTSVSMPDKIRAAELAEQDLNEAIKEQEFADTVASGFAADESIDSELGSSIDWQLADVKGKSGDLNTFESEDDEQNQEPLQASDSIQGIEHDFLKPGEEKTDDENLLAGIDAESPNSVDPDSEPDDLAPSSLTQTTAPLNKSTEFAAIETVVLISSDENGAGAVSAIDAPPEMEQDDYSEQASADAATHNDQAENQDSASEAETEVSSEDIRARAMRAQLRDDEALEQLPEENLAALKVMATPLELGSGQGRRWGATLGLALLACLLGAGMATQYLWRYNTVLSQEPMLRPLFASTCQLLGCSLEPYRNLSAIVSSNLSVRSHPERADAVMVNVELRNTAPFEQPFPIMVLGFNTASNNLVALREFTPEEYLDPGLRDVTQMPVLAPVQIDLALMDPGNDAVNYTLAFRQP